MSDHGRRTHWWSLLLLRTNIVRQVFIRPYLLNRLATTPASSLLRFSTKQGATLDANLDQEQADTLINPPHLYRCPNNLVYSVHTALPGWSSSSNRFSMDS